MITSTFGKLFLDAYNEKYGTQYDAKTFFVEQYWPLFFDHNKYMMTAGNSPLENPKISWKDMLAGKKPYESSEQRRVRLEKLIGFIESGVQDNKSALDHPTSELTQPTSSQVTDLTIPEKKEDVYLSWIGAGLALGVGGVSILINNKNVLLDIFSGWKIYRELLNNNRALTGNQISTWNSLWLIHKYSINFIESTPLANLDAFTLEEDILSVKVSSWTKVFVAISRQYKEPRMLGYVYSIGKSNITIGFIPFILSHIRRTYQLYEQIFGFEEWKLAEELFGTSEKFKICCQQGAIGIMALKPKGITKYLLKSAMPSTNDLQTKLIDIHTYQIWILAMLDKKELWEESLSIATFLKDFSESGGKARTNYKNMVKDILNANNSQKILEKLAEISENSEPKDAEHIAHMAKLLFEMPSSDVPSFLSLVRINYSLSINNSKTL